MPTTLRRAVNCVAIATALFGAGGLGLYFKKQHEYDQSLDRITQGLRRFEQVLTFHGASKDSETSERGWPLSVDVAWFASDIPTNTLLTPDRPWLEVATSEQATMTDPPVRIALSNSLAAYWYNPYTGIIRARVPIAISDAQALSLYNRLNGTSLDNIYSADAAPDPLAGAPAATGATEPPAAPSPAGDKPAPANQAIAGETPSQPN